MLQLFFLPIRFLSHFVGLKRSLFFIGLFSLVITSTLLIVQLPVHIDENVWKLVILLNTYLTLGLLQNITYDINQIEETHKESATANITPLTSLKSLNLELSKKYKSLQRQKKNLINRIDEISFSTGELRKSSNELAGNTESQTIATAAGAQSILEMSQGIDNIAEIIKNTAAMTFEAHSMANQGSDRVKQTTKGIHQLEQYAERSANLMISLNDQSQNIHEVTALIRSISEQTNLLALNAAIEAARAGEHGRGFSVVADEVRGLAQRSHQSANDISERISNITLEIQQAAESISEVRRLTQESVAETEQVESALDGIKNHTEELKTHMFSVASNTEQQSQASTEISKRIEEVHSSAEQNYSHAQRTAKVAEHLTHLSQPTKLKNKMLKNKALENKALENNEPKNKLNLNEGAH